MDIEESIPNNIRRWYHPRTSPLGPQTSVYHRHSKLGPQLSKGPSKSCPNLRIRCILLAFENDNSKRDPYSEKAQWCEDLLVTGLKDIFHPQYTCPHLYHPSDPEYDEEWAGESWSDEEWSDSDPDDDVTTLSDGNDEQGVKIIASEEEEQQAMDFDTETRPQWNSWTPISGASPISQPFFNAPSAWKHNADIADTRQRISTYADS
ncbi:hypothetical protein M422DRAFT_49574 [Sphaerobolus stellatus SS14]|uniref:Uncharacterized protein n=1 Tax=Sphaerobolus stellatus (strain SS14) TaxID=990650 RepID=A0A0C9UX61_SPHS4|nr:hypothetical protein M422DRAFT_49574 [Sphaerobolus stellatus SS14]